RLRARPPRRVTGWFPRVALSDLVPPMPSPRRFEISGVDARGLSTLLMAVLAFGAAGFGFGAYFYLVPYHRKSAQLDRLTKEARARSEASRPRMELLRDDADARLQAQLQSLQGPIEARLAGAGATVTVGRHRLLVRFPE